MSIHIGKKIKEIFEESGLSVSEVARRVKTSRQNIYTIFERRSTDTELLQRVGEALKYDFFQHYSNPSSPKTEEDAPDTSKKAENKRRVVLQIEVDEDKQNDILKLVLGEEGFEALKKNKE